MGTEHTTILWFRRDLRLEDHRALSAAAERGTIVPLFIHDASVEALGAAPKMRLEMSLKALASDLEAHGLSLIFRRGDPHEVLSEMIAETGATAVFWSRRYDPAGVAIDTAIKEELSRDGIDARSLAGTLLFEPWTVETGQGGPYRVYTPFWKAVRAREVPDVLQVPELVGSDRGASSDQPEDWHLSRDMHRGRAIVAEHVQAGERAALGKLNRFIDERIDAYKAERDFLDRAVTSELSDALSLGEISPAQCWHAAQRAMQEGAQGAEHFLKELVWREFAWHLMWHFPNLAQDNWRREWDAFPWIEDSSDPNFLAWCQGRTGVAIVDAAMREMYVTGKMHNRARMVAASYLTKHLGVHWRLGLAWFEACLVDWDVASNAMGWQWVAGSGPDAAPYFRIYNPDTQADKFDPKEQYRRRWLAEPYGNPTETALQFFEAAPRSWLLDSLEAPTVPIVGLKEGRAAALAAYENFKSQ